MDSNKRKRSIYSRTQDPVALLSDRFKMKIRAGGIRHWFMHEEIGVC